MPDTVIDVSALAATLESRVKADGISWRQAAGEIGASPSLLTRLRNDQRPDLDAFAKIVRWLRLPADGFLVDPDELAARSEPELNSAISALLRSRSDLNEQDKEHLGSILESGIAYFRQVKGPDRS